MSALECIGGLETLCEKLKQSLQSDFYIWEENADQWQVPVGMENRSLPQEIQNWLNSERDRLRSGQPATCQSPESGTVFAVPLTGEDDESIVAAIGFAAADSDCLASIIGDLSQSSLRHMAEIDNLKSMVAEYRRQVTDDFEERTFLRHVARYVEHCSLTTSIQGVASEILPRLQKLAGFHSLQLVIPSEGDHDSANEQATKYLQFGHQEMSEADGWRLVEEFAAKNDTRPVVLATERCAQLQVICPTAKSVVLTTLVRGDEHFGWLIAVNFEATEPELPRRRKSSMTNELGSVEASLLEATGILIASHAHNRRLYAAKEELTIELVRTLVAALDARDEYTCGHSDRVACMSRHLAKSLGLPETECQMIYLSGLLHDLGKIGISDSILLKNGRLTDEEFEKIKEHPQRGYDLLKRLKPLQPMLPGVLHHHESWDGSGYPHGLAGEDIPLIGRILAVADAFDAMTSNRPYRNGMPVAKAESILRDGAGSQWQPELIEVFLDQISEMTAICTDSRDRTNRLLGRSEITMNDQTDNLDDDGELTRVFRTGTHSQLCLDPTT